MKFLMVIFSLVFSLVFSLTSYANSILLTPSNHIVLRDVISAESVTATILSLEVSKEKTLYLFIDSPGGNVIEGLVLVHYLLSTKKDIRCIAKYAASMAHDILEACPVRIGTDDNILMQHKISSEAKGNATEFEAEIEVMKGLGFMLDTMETKRIGISLEAFRVKTSGPWVTFGLDSLGQNLVDEVVVVECDPVLYTLSKSKTIETTFGPVTLITNGCPLVSIIEKREER